MGPQMSEMCGMYLQQGNGWRSECVDHIAAPFERNKIKNESDRKKTVYEMKTTRQIVKEGAQVWFYNFIQRRDRSSKLQKN